MPGAQLADSIAWGGKEGTQDRQARSKESLTGAAMSIWKRAASKLFDLEAKIVTQVRLPLPVSHQLHQSSGRTWRKHMQRKFPLWQAA